jgi:lipoprotein NlpI
MRRIIPLLLALGLVANSMAASSPDALLREAGLVARTNIPAALALCDKAIAEFPTNAQPLSVRARVLDVARRYDEGIRDLSAALKLEPRSAPLWQGRGEMNFKAGHFKESVADFDRVIELSPTQAPHHWQRGISLYYAGRFSDGRKQFESHQTVNPNDVENAAWHFLCAARESGVTNAREVMLTAGPDGRIPMKEVYALYRGKGSVEEVLAAAGPATEKWRRDGLFYAHLYLGLYFDALGNAAKAREHITKAANDFESAHYMGDVARVHLRKLDAAAR